MLLKTTQDTFRISTASQVLKYWTIENSTSNLRIHWKASRGRLVGFSWWLGFLYSYSVNSLAFSSLSNFWLRYRLSSHRITSSNFQVLNFHEQWSRFGKTGKFVSSFLISSHSTDRRQKLSILLDSFSVWECTGRRRIITRIAFDFRDFFRKQSHPSRSLVEIQSLA
jgi:hypothetical protein